MADAEARSGSRSGNGMMIDDETGGDATPPVTRISGGELPVRTLEALAANTSYVPGGIRAPTSGHYGTAGSVKAAVPATTIAAAGAPVDVGQRTRPGLSLPASRAL
jgi:hypothetical protein